MSLTQNPPPRADPTPTDPPSVGLRRLRRARVGRRLVLALVAAFVGLGLLGFLGPRSGSVQAHEGPWLLEVDHAFLNRAGLAAPFSFTVTHQGGFDEPVTVRVAESFLSALDEHGLDPEPAESTAGDSGNQAYVQWTFDPPEDGEVLTVAFDGRVEPGQRGRVAGFVEVRDDEGPAPRAEFDMWLLP